MNIRLVSGSYKSLKEFGWLDVPMFAIVTGPNGSGKTQMLELIARAVGLDFPPEGMEYRMMRGLQPSPFEAKVELSPPLSSRDVVFLRSSWPVSGGSASLQSVIEQGNQAWSEKGRPERDRAWDRLWSIIEESLGRPRNEINNEEFLHVLPPNFPLLSDTGFTGIGIPALFVSYLDSMDILQKKGYTKAEIEAELKPLPWDILDGILETAGLPYRVVTPTLPAQAQERLQARETIQYTLTLKDRYTGQGINPTDLSSGERVMFQVALWFFSFSLRRGAQVSGDSRRLLLLDEPDAHLHPALTKAFLDVISSEIVDKHGIRVIMTTHAPSTVALAPDSSVFVMSRQAPRIRPAESKWEAVGQLTAGFVTIGSGSKCVFVEDEDDRYFYSTLQEMLMAPSAGDPSLDRSQSILFISADSAHPGEGKGKTSGGKENVVKWVEAIPSTQIAGIIDHDAGNPGGPRIHVLARYDLEAYLLDPLFVYAVLLENKKAPTVPGVTLSVHDARGILRKNSAWLQAVVDTMCVFVFGGHNTDYY